MVSDSDQEIESSLTSSNTSNISINVMDEDTAATLVDSKQNVLEEAFATLVIPPSSSSSSISSSCYSSCSAPVADHHRHRCDHGDDDDEEEAVESKDVRRDNIKDDDDDDDDDDDGYHTPTSPRHRILAPLTCPPAPIQRKNRFLKEDSVCDADGDDDGYHTPTSPRHIIPEPLTCPPAPVARLRLQPCRKRKAVDDRFQKLPKMWDFRVELEELQQARKTAKRDDN